MNPIPLRNDIFNNRKQFVRGLLSSFYTTSKRDVVSIFKAFILSSRELESKIGLLISFTLEYLIRIDSTINIFSITKDLFVTNLATLFLSLLKLRVKLTFEYRFLKESIFLTTLI
jgi:hypothetical protein